MKHIMCIINQIRALAGAMHKTNEVCRANMPNNVFEQNQIKVAFVEMFNESGEWWFGYFDSPEENLKKTEYRWEFFVEHLNDAKNGTDHIQKRTGKTSHSWA